MTRIKLVAAGLLMVLSSPQLKANDTLHLPANDSLTLAQAYVNLTLTANYFDSVPVQRLGKILQFEQNELSSLTDSNVIRPVNYLYHVSYALLYFNKAQLLFRTAADTNREVLLQWKNTLDSAITSFNLADLNHYFPARQNNYNEFIRFSDTAARELKRGILRLKGELAPYFNNNIYPDFQRIYYEAKNSGHFHFDSLTYYAGMFNLPVGLNIIANTKDEDSYDTKIKLKQPWYYKIDANYPLNPELDLIARYLQLDYMIAGGQYSVSIKDTATLCASYWNYLDDLRSYYNTAKPGSFFQHEINIAQAEKLYRDLRDKYPLGESETRNPRHMKLPMVVASERPVKYYFPIPAPFPSAYLSAKNYKPALITMKQVDNYFQNIFNKKGYAGHLHYYYVQSGYAMTTSLEKIDKDGTPVSGSKRWSVSVGGNGSFSLYETFKSIFFATESNFRVFALIISADAATVQRSAASIGAMQDLLTYSYPSLPKDLEDFSLPQKTLTVLIYNFYQSDIGKVPMLDVSKHLTVKNHLEKSGLGELLK